MGITILPLAAPRKSGHEGIYRDYLSGIGAASARRILVLLLVSLLLAESVLRLAQPRYRRTAISSLHGIRAIMQQVLDDRGRKIIAVGDSTLAGGGVAQDDQIIAGRWQNTLPAGVHFYNLAAPGGDATTSLLMLDVLQRAHVIGAERVVIEVLPSKFFTDEKTEATPRNSAAATIEELQRYVPDIRPETWGLPGKHLSNGERLEGWTQWKLGQLSLLYRHRDFFRTGLTGNYPIYWLIGRTLPRSLMARAFPAKAQGTNRLAARADDFPYDSAAVPSSPGGYRTRFAPHLQGDYLEKCVALAQSISRRPPIILVFPIHYEYGHPEEAERASILTALSDFKSYLEQMAQRTRSDLILVPSESFQQARWWTRSVAHFNAEGSERIWRVIEPQVRALSSPNQPPTP